MYPPTPCHAKLLQASSLESPQPFLLHPVHLATLPSRISTRRNFRFFRGQPSQPLPSPPFSIFSSLRQPIHRVSTRSTLSYRSPSEHTYSPPLTRHSHCETTTGPTSWFFTERRGKRVTVYIVVIFSNGFRRIDLRRLHVPSWSRADVTRRQDHFRRRFFPRWTLWPRALLSSIFSVNKENRHLGVGGLYRRVPYKNQSPDRRKGPLCLSEQIRTHFYSCSSMFIF